MILSLLLLLAGVVLAWFGGSLFVAGAVGLAKWALYVALTMKSANG
jgi:membrane protein implicated in regulation of membrane protease activity